MRLIDRQVEKVQPLEKIKKTTFHIETLLYYF